MVKKLFLAFVVVTTIFAVAGVFWSQITSLFGNKQSMPEITVQDLRQLQLNQATETISMIDLRNGVRCQTWSVRELDAEGRQLVAAIDGFLCRPSDAAQQQDAKQRIVKRP